MNCDAIIDFADQLNRNMERAKEQAKIDTYFKKKSVDINQWGGHDASDATFKTDMVEKDDIEEIMHPKTG